MPRRAQLPRTEALVNSADNRMYPGVAPMRDLGRLTISRRGRTYRRDTCRRKDHAPDCERHRKTPPHRANTDA